MQPFQTNTVVLLALAYLAHQAFAFSGAFYSVNTCNDGDSSDFSYYSMDTTSDNGTCTNIGDNIGTGFDDNFCGYYTNGGNDGPSDCPNPDGLTVKGVGINTALTHNFTRCAFYSGKDCADPTNGYGRVVQNGCLDTSAHPIGSFKCYPMLPDEPTTDVRVPFQLFSFIYSSKPWKQMV